jgi:hypothetical protein
MWGIIVGVPVMSVCSSIGRYGRSYLVPTFRYLTFWFGPVKASHFSQQIASSQTVYNIACQEYCLEHFDKYSVGQLTSCVHEQKAYMYSLHALHVCIEYALSIGVATVVNKKILFVKLMDRVPWFEAYWSQFFAKFDAFIAAYELLRCLKLEIFF